MNTRVAGLAMMGICLAAAARAGDLYTDNLSVNETAHFYGPVTVQAIEPGTLPSSGLLLHYAFSTNGSGFVEDLSGNGMHGVALGNASWDANGRVDGGCYDLDGSGDYIEVERTFSGDVLTTSMWFSNRVSLSKSSSQWIISFYYTTASGGSAGIPFGNATGFLTDEIIHTCVPVSNSKSGWCDSSATIPTGWHHLATRWEGTFYEIWLDGQRVDNQYAGLPQTKFSGRVTHVGARNPGDYGFNGLVDEVRLYTSALSTQEVINLYLGGIPLQEAAGRLTVGRLAAASNATIVVESLLAADAGVTVPPLGDLSMGIYTNQP